jgi:hypothetical protein
MRHAFESRHMAAQPDDSHQVAPHQAARVRDAVGKSGLRVQQDARRFAGARRQNHDACPNDLLGAGSFVDIDNASGLAVSVGQHFAHHRIGEQLQLPGLHRREHLHLARRIR